MWRATTLLVLTLLSSLLPGIGQAEPENPLSFEQKISDMMEVRTAAYRFARDNGVLESNAPLLTREQTNQLRHLARQYLDSRHALLPEAEAAARFFDNDRAPQLSQARPTGVEVVQGSGDGPLALQYSINPDDENGRQQMLQILRGLAAAMVLWDSYRVAVMPYEKSSGLQYNLTYDVDASDSLRMLSRNYYSPELRSRLVNATLFADAYAEWRRQHSQPMESEEEYLYGLAQSTAWYKEVRESGAIRLEDSLQQLGSDLGLRRQRLVNIFSYGLSMGFGNMVGVVQTRHGLLYRMPPADMEHLAAELKPLDILLEKTPFRLTDKMIPGHYGHVAVWLGSEEELRTLGLWEQIAPAYQERIRQGGRIVEALRSGVTISTLPHFLNIDDLLVLRDQRPEDENYRRQAILTALEQVGKEYDFNFDVYTHQRIVCSELAYVVFPDVHWPLARTLGRYTISPDNVAQMAIGKTATFSPVIIYRDGKRVVEPLEPTLAKLISGPTHEDTAAIVLSVPAPALQQ